MSETTDDEGNDESRLMTRIDGEAARLLVHIEPIEDADGGPTEGCGPPQPSPPDSSGLVE
jgi:hypothetical protein